MTQTVWIVRHGHRYDFERPEWFETATRRYDPPLSARGVQQAKELGKRLQGEGIDRIVASPFRRTAETAYHVAEALDLPISLEWGICEWLNPEWMTQMPETAPIEELSADFPRIDRTYHSRITPTYPETPESVCWKRTGDTAKQLIEESSSDLLLVGHGATLMGIAKALMGGEPEIRAAFCAVLKFVRSGDGWRMELNGDTSYLSETESKIRFN